MSQIVAFSGGKDSTAMALRLAELDEDFSMLFTPTGDELPEVEEHIRRVVQMTGRPLVRLEGKSLYDLIESFQALPNFRQRWCTRMLKIVPAIAYLQQHPGSTLCVGLRADEEERTGLFGDYATYRYPLRTWAWGVNEVLDYCRSRGVSIPRRTDCALCYHQRLGEWFDLWRLHPERFQRGVDLEARIGHTFRSPGRDTQPVELVHLRKKFEEGYVPRGWKSDDDEPAACRVCRF